MVTLPGVILISAESNRISASVVMSSGIATTAGLIAVCGLRTSSATRTLATINSQAKKAARPMAPPIFRNAEEIDIRAPPGHTSWRGPQHDSDVVIPLH